MSRRILAREQPSETTGEDPFDHQQEERPGIGGEEKERPDDRDRARRDGVLGDDRPEPDEEQVGDDEREREPRLRPRRRRERDDEEEQEEERRDEADAPERRDPEQSCLRAASSLIHLAKVSKSGLSYESATEYVRNASQRAAQGAVDGVALDQRHGRRCRWRGLGALEDGEDVSRPDASRRVALTLQRASVVRRSADVSSRTSATETK